MVKTIEIGKIQFKELAAAVKDLNACELLTPKIVTVGKSKQEIVDDFIKGVLSIPDDDQGNWKGPESVAVYYQKITVAEVVEKTPEKSKATKEPKAPKPAKEPKAPKPAKEPKAPKPAKKNRLEVTGETILSSLNTSGVEVAAIVKAADEAYAKEGGKSNEKESKWATNVALSVLKGFGAIRLDDGKVCIK